MTNGMKPGSGTDPFADVDNDDETEEIKKPENGSDSQPGGSERDDRVIETTSDTDESSTGPINSGLPFIYARDGVKQARSHTFQLHYLSETYQREKRVQSDLEDRLGEDIYKVDLREAMVQAAFENLDDVADILREWGYDAE